MRSFLICLSLSALDKGEACAKGSRARCHLALVRISVMVIRGGMMCVCVYPWPDTIIQFIADYLQRLVSIVDKSRAGAEMRQFPLFVLRVVSNRRGLFASL